ncbi:hypothetical protein [Kitasatospora sp. NPDC088346]|uniref:hypothetical protein n=1 Tax=Kitasatospora sp. NPDC088346 TaxID=3364073 RepID=UPI0038107A89
MAEQDAERDKGMGGDQGGEGDARKPERGRPAPKARLVFGDPLERQTSDDTDQGWGERPARGDSGGRGLDWYLSQRPPHHGD